MDLLLEAEAGTLNKRLNAFGHKFPNIGNVCVALHQNNSVVNARLGVEGTNPLVAIGCLAKVFTATLISQLISQSTLNLNENIAELLPIDDGKVRACFSGVTLRHLMNNTHGLDGPIPLTAPIATTGFIDIQMLCDILSSAPPLAEPGEVYNCTNAGAYLAAAIIECTCGRPFRDVLYHELLKPLSVATTESIANLALGLPAVCPATGGQLLLPVCGISEFINYHLGRVTVGEKSHQRALNCLLEESHPLPGWHPLESAAGLVWKQFHSGWYGHDGRWLGNSVVVRLHPRRGIAIIITGEIHRGDPTIRILANLFGDLFPELVTCEVPQLLTKEENRALELERYVGRYKSSSGCLAVTQEGDQLNICATHNPESNPPIRVPVTSHRLRGAKQHVFWTDPPELHALPFVQFVSPLHDRGFEYIWNGRNVWRRVDR